MKLEKIAVISDEFKEFIQSGNYEVTFLILMNKSRIVFLNRYIRNENQPNSECDFVDMITEEKYEVKLPFDKKERVLICSNKGNLKEWLVYMMNEEAEFGELIIEKRGQHNITELKLYKTLEKRVKTVQENENAIFFFPLDLCQYFGRKRNDDKYNYELYKIIMWRIFVYDKSFICVHFQFYQRFTNISGGSDLHKLFCSP